MSLTPSALSRSTKGEESIMLSTCHCQECDNKWWVKCAPEHEPSYCCYCGIKFSHYFDGDGKECGMSGLPRI